MSEILRVLSNSAFIAGQRLANALLQFLFFLLLIHLLASEEMGIFELGRACLEIGAGIVAPGLAIILLREGSRNPAWWSQYASSVQFILLSGSLAAGLVIFLLANISTPTLTQLTVTGLFCLSIYFQSSCTAYESYLIALDRVKWSMIVSVLCNLSVVALVLVLIQFTPHPLVSASILLYLRWVINHLIYSYRLRLEIRPERLTEYPVRESIIQLFRDSWPLTVGSIFFIIYARIDTLMLEWMGSPVSIALYSGAYRLIGLLSMLFLSLYQALAPTISRRLSVSYRQALYLVISVGSLLGMVGLALSILIQYVGHHVVLFLYPDTYELTAQGLRILAWTLPVIFLGNAFGYFLVNETTRGPKYYAAINFLGVCINIVGNAIVIPRYDFIGAAWMTVGTDACTTLLMLVAVMGLCLRRDEGRLAKEQI